MLDTSNSSHQCSFWPIFLFFYLFIYFFGSRCYCIFSTLNELLLLLLLLLLLKVATIIFETFAELFVSMFF